MNYLTNFEVSSPLLALAGGALAVLLLDLVLPARRAHTWWFLAALGAVLTAAWYTLTLWPRDGGAVVAFQGALVADRFGLLIAGIILAAALATVALSLHRTEDDTSGYLALVLWAAMGMIVLVMAGSLMTVFLGLELLSLALYVAVAFAPGVDRAREAALKYFVLGSVAAGFMLFGFALMYGTTGTFDLTRTQMWVGLSSSLLPQYFVVGIGLALIGFAFKLALVPFHIWAPDVYQGAPTPITAFMAVGTKAAAFGALVRFCLAVATGPQAERIILPIGIMAALSMFVGSLGAIRQHNLKRLLAFSGIASAGYLLMGLPGLTEGGIGAGAYYLVTYLFTATGAFAAIIYLDQQGEDGDDIGSYAGLLYRRPVLAVAVLVMLFSLVGLPPTGGFAGKFLLALAAVKAGAWYLLGALILSTGIAAYAYLRVVTAMMQKNDTVPSGRRRGYGSGIPAAGEIAAARDGGPVQVPPNVVAGVAAAVLGLAVAGTLVTGLFPAAVVDLVQRLLP